MCTMAITTLAMVATVFVLNLYSMKEKPVPPWARKLLVVYLSRVLCMCAAPQESSSSTSSTFDMKNHVFMPKRTEPRPRFVTVQETGKRGQRGSLPTDCKSCSDTEETTVPLNPLYGNNFGVRDRKKALMSELHSDANKAKANKPKADYNKDWVHVAAVCDRLFFWLCLMFILVTTLLLFHPLTTSKLFG